MNQEKDLYYLETLKTVNLLLFIKESGLSDQEVVEAINKYKENPPRQTFANPLAQKGTK